MTTLMDNPDTRFLTPAQLEMGGRLAFQNDKLKSLTPYLLGAYIDAICLGVMTVLFIRWCCESRPTDGRLIRCLVYWLCICALGLTFWMQAQIVLVFGGGFGQYRYFLSVDWVRWSGLISIAPRVPASCFFLHRAHRLCNNAIWPIVVVVPMLVSMVGLGIASVIRFDRLPYSDELTAISISASAIDLAHDLVLTGTIATQLYRSKTGWAGTDRLIHKLLLSFAESQAPPTCIATLMLLILVLLPNSTILRLFLFHPKIHSICVLVVLLTRVRMREEQAGSNIHSKSINLSMFKSSLSKGVNSKISRSGGEVHAVQSSTGGNESVARLVPSVENFRAGRRGEATGWVA